MRRWKILNDSDKQSNASSKHHSKSKVEMTVNGQSRLKRKQYTPLRRSKAENKEDSNKSANASHNFFPSYTQKYIKCVDSASNADMKKIKTQYTDDMLGFGMESLEEIQQNYLNQVGTQRLSQRKVNNKINQLHDRLSSINLNTQRHPVKFFNTQKQKQSPIIFPRFRKVLTYKSKREDLKQAAHILKKQHKNLKQQIRTEFCNFQQQIKNNILKWKQQLCKNLQKPKNSIKISKINQILQEYNQYKSKMQNLDQQKQVFLHTLIRMAPV